MRSLSCASHGELCHPNDNGEFEMLEALRRGAKSWVMRGFLLALAGTFVVFFGSDIGGGSGNGGVQGGGSGSVVEVGDQNFTPHQISREFNEQVQQFSARTGQQLDTQTAIRIGLLDQTLARLVSQSLFDQAAQKLGLAASVDAASEAIRNLPQFQDQSGRFSRQLFERFLSNQGQDEGAFVNQVRLDLLRSQYVGTLQNAIATPTALRDNLFARRNERRVADIVTLPLGAASAVGNPDAAQLAQYYQENRDSFETPELRNATIASLDTEQLAKTVVVPEEDIREEYEARSNDFQVSETRNIVQSSFATRDEADKATAQMRDGKTLTEASEEVGGIIPVELTAVTRGDIALPALAEAAFALQTGTTSAPVESSLGWHLVQVSNVTPGRTIPFSEARTAIRDELAREESIDLIFDVLNDVEDGLAGGASFNEVARDSNLAVSTIAPIARDGRTESGAVDDNPAITAELVGRLFGLNGPGASEVIESRSGGFVVVRLDNIASPAIPDLSEIRDLATQSWRADRVRDRVEEIAAKITDRAKRGDQLEALAREFGGRFERTPAFDRTGDGATVPLPLIAPLFEAKPGDIVEQPVAAGVAVAKLVQIETADLNDPARDELTATIRGQLANDLVAQLANALREEIEVNIDQDALEATFLPQ